MTRNAVAKVLLVVAVPITGLAYVAVRELPIVEPQRAEAPALTPVERIEPIDLRGVDEPLPVGVEDLPVYVEPKWQPAPASRVEPAPPPNPEVREVLAGRSARQSKRSNVRMWGVHQSDTAIAIDGARRSASELSGRYRSEDKHPSFDGVGRPGASAEPETGD